MRRWWRPGQCRRQRADHRLQLHAGVGELDLVTAAAITTVHPRQCCNAGSMERGRGSPRMMSAARGAAGRGGGRCCRLSCQQLVTQPRQQTRHKHSDARLAQRQGERTCRARPCACLQLHKACANAQPVPGQAGHCRRGYESSSRGRRSWRRISDDQAVKEDGQRCRASLHWQACTIGTHGVAEVD